MIVGGQDLNDFKHQERMRNDNPLLDNQINTCCFCGLCHFCRLYNFIDVGIFRKKYIHLYWYTSDASGGIDVFLWGVIMNKITLKELKIRLAEFRKEWCRSQKNDKDILMFAHMCHVLDVHPELALTPNEILNAERIKTRVKP